MNGKPNGKFEIRASSSTDSGHPGESERKLFVHSSKTNSDFEFVLKGSHISVVPLPTKENPDLFDEIGVTRPPKIEDWYKAFTEHERARIIQAILVNYRIVSKNNNVTVAAVGVVNNPDPYAEESKKHLLYVGRNTNIGAADVYKSCAEQNMIRAAENSFEGYMNDRHMEMPEEPYLKEVFVMGGRLPDNKKEDDKGLHAICPCGMCTDILAKKMVKGGRVYVYPHTNKIMEFPIDNEALDFCDVKPGHIWRTSIENLDRHRRIKVDDLHPEIGPEINRLQRDGIVGMAKTLARELDPDFVRPEPSERDLERHMENYKKGYHSIAELDIGEHHGTINSPKINAFLRNQIKEILKDRIERDDVPKDYQHILKWMKEKVVSVSCSVIQTDDGHFYVGYDSKTGRENAYVSAAFSAVGAAVPKLGNHGIQGMWTMEYNPKAIEHGYIYTPEKDALERLMKRQSSKVDAIRVNVLPFNALPMEAKSKLARVLKLLQFTTRDLCPGGFMGENRQVESRNGGGGNDDPSNGLKEHYKKPHLSFVDRLLTASQNPSNEPDLF